MTQYVYPFVVSHGSCVDIQTVYINMSMLILSCILLVVGKFQWETMKTKSLWICDFPDWLLESMIVMGCWNSNVELEMGICMNGRKGVVFVCFDDYMICMFAKHSMCIDLSALEYHNLEDVVMKKRLIPKKLLLWVNFAEAGHLCLLFLRNGTYGCDQDYIGNVTPWVMTDEVAMPMICATQFIPWLWMNMIPIYDIS